MVETVIYLLLQIAIIALVVYLIIWVIETLGLPIPPRVVQIIWVIVVLIVLLLLWRALGSTISMPRRL